MKYITSIGGFILLENYVTVRDFPRWRVKNIVTIVDMTLWGLIVLIIIGAVTTFPDGNE